MEVIIYKYVLFINIVGDNIEFDQSLDNSHSVINNLKKNQYYIYIIPFPKFDFCFIILPEMCYKSLFL